MPHATSDEVYHAAQRYVSDREDYDRCLARWGSADPQTIAASIRLGTAFSRLRLTMTGLVLHRAVNE